MKSDAKQINPAQMADKMLNRTAMGVGIVTLAYIISVSEYFLSGMPLTIVSYIQLGLSLVVLIILFPTFVNFMKMRTSHKQACSEVEGFLSSAFNKAASTSFRWTFIFLLCVELTVKKTNIDLPLPFYVDLIMAFTLGIFSLTFYLLVRRDNDFEDIDDEDFEGKAHSKDTFANERDNS